MSDEIIKEIIDTHLQSWIDRGLNMLPGKIEPAMTDPNQNENEEWKTWLPIASQVTDQEIESFESQIRYNLPADYKVFLKHKHFYDLHISELSFFRHPINVWVESQLKAIFKSNPTEYLIDKGYLPFADWSDWGILCFDTNRAKENHNYPIVLWDHEIEDEVQDEYKDFYSLLVESDRQAQNSSR